MSFVSASGGGAPGAESVTWNLGTIPPSDPPQTFVLTLNPNAAAGDPFNQFGPTVTNDVSVSSSTTDLNTGNDSGSAARIKVCTKLGDDGPNQLTGTTGNDWLCGRGGNDTLNGTGGNDVVQGNDGNDSLDDTESVPGYSNGNDILEAGNGSDVVNGGRGGDRLSGAFFAESVAAGEGSGADDGKDTLTYRNAPQKGGPVQGVSVRLREGQAFHLESGLIVRDELWKNSATDNTFEDVVGSEFGDDLIGDNDNNFLAGRGCANTSCTSLADSYYTAHAPDVREQGGDVLHGGQGNDVLTGASGNDALRGGAGADTISGGLGNDLVAGGLADSDNDGVPDTSNDVIDGGDGLDLVWYFGTQPVNVNLTSGSASGQGTDSLANIENIRGSEVADTLIGNGVTNSIDGGGGADSIEGRAGNDASDATGIGINVNSTPYPGLTGGAGNDSIFGNNGDDFLVGGAGNGDVLNGGNGTDLCENIPSGQTRAFCEAGT